MAASISRRTGRSRSPGRPAPLPYKSLLSRIPEPPRLLAPVTHAIQECLNRLRIREVLTYQPISRYWPFQWYETAIFVGLALVLAAFCFWWVRRRLS